MRIEQIPATSANPVLSIDKNGYILYSNEAGNTLLNDWDVRVGAKLPSSIVNIVQRVIALNSPEKTEVKVGNKTYVIVISPLPEQELVIISGFDISNQKELEAHLFEAYEEMQAQSEELQAANEELQTQSEEIKTKTDELLEAYKSLQERESEILTLTRNSPDLIARFDKQNHCLYANPAFVKFCYIPPIAEFYGWSKSELIDKTQAELQIDPELVKLSEKQRAKVFATGVSEELDFQYISPQGKKYYLDTKIVPEFVKGEVTSVLVISRDITDLKEAEATLKSSNLYNRSLIEASLDPLVVIGNDGSVTDVNQATEEATGYSRNDLIGTYFAQYLTEPDQAISAFIHVCTHGELRDCALEIKHQDGHITPVLCNASVYRDENGEIIGVFVAARDIINRKHAEEALKKAHNTLEEKVKERTAELEKAYDSLKESEARLAEAQRIAHIGNYDNNIVTSELYWSDELYRIIGLKPQEGITYERFLTYVHPDDRDYVYNSVNDAYNGNIYAINYRIVRPDGEERIIHSEREVIFDKKNKPVRIKGTLQDITEQRKTEEDIRHLANIVEYSGDAIGTLSLEGVITSWNKGAESIYGYSAQEILGKHISLPSPNHLKRETQAYIELIKQTGMSYNYLSSKIRKSGELISVSINLSPIFDNHDQLTAISFITRDITELTKSQEKLRESEEKYRNIVETANEGIALVNSEGMITYVNKKMADMLGYTIGEIFGAYTWDFVENKSTAITLLENKRKGISESIEIKLIHKDGSPLWVHLNSKPFFDNNGKFTGSLGMFTDITERKIAEEALNYIEIARKKEIHHRIKNNLQVISSLLDLQADKIKHKKKIKKSEVQEAFRESQDRVISMALIHEELHKGGEIDTLNFSHYVEELADNLLLTYRICNNGIILNTEIEKDIFFDMDMAVPLGIIVNELVSNSLKYAFPDRDKGEIRIKLQKEESCSSNYILSISDNGVGVPEDFDIEKLDSLGLQLVTTLVAQLDGELELNRVNGSEFIIRLSVTEKNCQELVQGQLL